MLSIPLLEQNVHTCTHTYTHTHIYIHTQRQSLLCTLVQKHRDNYINQTVQNRFDNQWEKHSEQRKQASELDCNITLIVELIVRQGIKLTAMNILMALMEKYITLKKRCIM